MLINQVEKLFVHGRCLLLVTVPNRSGRAVVQVVAQQCLSYPPQRFLNRGDLNHDIRAVPLLLDHFLEPANLAFNSPQPLQI